MAIIKWRDGARTTSALPSLMENFFGRDLFDLGNIAAPGATLPAVNIRETKDSFIVEVAAPGMKKNDFKVKLDNNQLIISSEREIKEEDRDEDYTRKEYSYESFQRTFTLPQSAIADNITAKYADGVLNIVIPKKEEAKQKPAKEIKIS